MKFSTSHFVSRLVVGVILINLFVFGLSAYSLYTSRIHYEKQAKTEMENLARSLEYNLSGILGHIDLGLWSEKTEAERQLAHGGIKTGALNAHMAGTLSKMSEMANLRMADYKGAVIYGVEPGAGPVANVADRDYFIFLRDNPGDSLFISKPIVGRISNKWVIIIARRVDGPDGSFAGVIQGTLPISILQEQFSTFNLGQSGMITLRDKNLSILIRYPQTENSTPGNLSVTDKFMKMVRAGQPTGTYHAVSRVDGINRLISYRKVGTYPLFVNCGIATKDYLLAWYREAAINITLLTLFAMSIVTGAFFVIKSWKHTQHALDDLAVARDELELRVAERTQELQTSNLALIDQKVQLQTEVQNRTAAQDELALKNIELQQEIKTRKQAEQERKNLENKMQQAQKLESLGILAGGIAHDFNNILTAIVGHTHLALMKINPESPIKENLDKVEQAASRAAELSKQMLAYAGKGRFVVEPLDLNRLLEEMLHMLEISISKKATLRLDLQKPLPSIEGDATQMRQIFMNLVINASEALGDTGGVIAISTGHMSCDLHYLKDFPLDENLPEGEYVYVEVNDTGCGMDRTTLSKIFDPFFTTKFTGRGLGMSAVLGIVRGHKGAIKVYSEPGKGSSFKVLLPASEKTAESLVSEVWEDNWKGCGKVLFADDEETVRDIGSAMLRELGFEVVTVEDGLTAVEVFKAETDFDYVILDLTMPQMDGEQAFRELRRIQPDVKVIMTSGYNERDVTQKFVGKDLTGFIQKPYTLSMVRDVMCNLAAKSG